MKSVFSLLSLFLLVSVFGFSKPPEECYIKIKIKNEAQVLALSKIVSIDHRKSDQYLYAYTATNRLGTLKKQGYEFTRLPHPGKNPNVKMGMLDRSGNRAWDAFPTYSEYTQMMQDFAINYPDICQLSSIGTSTNNSRPHQLWVLKITDQPGIEEEEPEVFFTSTMHGDETTGFPTMLHFIDELLSHYDPLSADPYVMEITDLIDNTEIWINPLANPDGTYFNNDTSVGGAIRNYTTSTGSNSFVDPNRNFPDPKDGPHPDGNVYWAETQAMMDFAEQHHFVISANFHGGAEVANYPWDNWARRHPDDQWFIQICREYADQAQADGPSGYFTDLNNGITNGHDWYIVAGGRQDFGNYWHGCKEVTVEISGTKNPSGSLLPAYWTANKLAFLQYFQQTQKGIHGVVTAQGGAPIDATIEIIGHDTVEDQSMVYTDPTIGDFYRMLLPGTYTVRASSYGYIDQEFSSITVPSNGRIRQDFNLQAAQSITVSGNIKSSPSGESIQQATVELLETPINPELTDAQGNFQFSGVLEGTYTFRISATNHENMEEERLITQATSNQDFSLPFITIFYTEDFESDQGTFLGTSSWAWGTPTTSPVPHSSSNLWATNLNGNYGDSEQSYLTIDNILVPAQYPKLKFWHWYDFEGSGTLYDGGTLEISTDGINFTAITPQGGYTGSVVGLGGLQGYSGNSSTWIQATFDLASYQGQTITIRWRFGSDASETRLGWYIDDVEISGQEDILNPIFLDSFESGNVNKWSSALNSKR